MRFAIPMLLLIATLTAVAPAQTTASSSCAPLGSAATRTTLYFGLNRKAGNISTAQWKAFLRDEVTTRFPQGLTVWEAGGQWRRADGAIVHERSKVLLLVHDGSPAVNAAITSIIERYKQRFEQESVLWETSYVCAAF